MAFTYSHSQKSNTPVWRQKRYILLLVGTMALVVLILELTNTTHIFHKSKPVSGTIPSTTLNSDESKDSSNGNSDNGTTDSTTNGSPPLTQKTTAPPVSGSNLIAPSGSFVSNHSPSLSNSPGMESVCVTTPGAACTITFTKDGIIKTLESRVADTNGTVVWAWNIAKAGFDTGGWNIAATATLDGQAKSTNDLKNLEVNP